MFAAETQPLCDAPSRPHRDRTLPHPVVAGRELFAAVLAGKEADVKAILELGRERGLAIINVVWLSTGLQKLSQWANKSFLRYMDPTKTGNLILKLNANPARSRIHPNNASALPFSAQTTPLHVAVRKRNESIVKV